MAMKQQLMASAARMASVLRGQIVSMFRYRATPGSHAMPGTVAQLNVTNPTSSNQQHTILYDRAAIHVEIGRAARLGYVPDAHIHRLHANHVEELEGDQRELGQIEGKLLATLRRLAALFPEPPAPQPESAPAAPARAYRRASSMFEQPHSEVRH